MFIPIDFENWNRKELYEHYYGYQLTFTLQIDITDLYNYIKKENTEIAVTGRHDPCIVQRAAIVTSCTCAIAVYDVLAQRYGTDYFI